MANTLTGNESLQLPEFDTPPADPLGLLDRWLGIAAEHGVREPLAVALATVDAHGHPASRIVLVKEVADGALLSARTPAAARVNTSWPHRSPQ